MKSKLHPILALVLSAGAGWWLADAGLTSSSDSSAGGKSRTSSARSMRSSSETARPVSVSVPAVDQVPISKLNGLGSLKGSPRLSAAFWMADTDDLTDPGFPHLADWLELSEAQRTSLAAILRHAARERRDREKSLIHARRTDPGAFQLTWIDLDPESQPALKQALAAEFGDSLAELIHLRANLHRFFEPVPNWKERGVAEIGLKIASRTGGDVSSTLSNGSQPSAGMVGGMVGGRRGGGISLTLSNGDWSLAVHEMEKKSPFKSFPRLDHLFDYQTDAAEIFDSNPQVGHPVAAVVPGKPGFAISPYSNNIIDIRGMPAGTLVSDPTQPPENKAYFRVPPQEETE